MPDSLRPAVFLDRDGTLIVDRHYLADPEGVELLPGAGEAVARLNAAGFVVVLATNQSGIARGYFTEAQYAAVHARLVRELAQHGARLDAEYHSPDFEDGGPDAERKPGAGMFLRAAREHGVDLARSWWVGDRRRDVQAAGRFGARGFLVCSPETEAEATAGMPFIRPVRSTAQAVEMILAESES
ncbi:D-glycero-alpha-D-manno-heptose-1,7-bisphosphate 7-phosphatase [Longimicrobium sp.]|uniref:D-glycero-alpha-D-manno-heptose-1,7-bisphosphate 7-phosphatase n=1 Tax=Longimicrobium sp. TaxID=2029185 RepID=UPI003B39FD5E